ncbi:MAG: hypothetical protein IT546_12835 [Caulobacteraceae bacterium]|nr:hypothetical protein [Caulobacteraceae bacterium]
MTPDPLGPADLRELSYGEHLVVWALRAFAAGRIQCPTLVREFRSACGELAAEARNAFIVFAQQLAARGRRPIVLAAPGCLTLTRDEQIVCALFADAQGGAEARFEARLAYLLGRAAEPPFFAAAEVTARALALNGHRLAAFAQITGAQQNSPRAERSVLRARA